MRMDDHGRDLVERHPSEFFASRLDLEKTALARQVAAILSYVDNLVQYIDPAKEYCRTLTRRMIRA